MRTGGAERVAALLANAWAARGDMVRLLVTFSGRGECAFPLSQGVDLAFLADLANQADRDGLGYLRRFRALRRLIKEDRPDIIVSFLTHVNVAAILASLGLRCPVIVCERVHPPMVKLDWPWGWLRRVAYPRADRVVMLSPDSVSWLTENVPGAKGAVIPNPVEPPQATSDPAVAPESVIPKGRRLLLAAGRLEPQKGFDLLLAAFARLAANHPTWSLAIVGQGTERARLEEAVRSLGLHGRVFMPGQVGNIEEWYRRADLFTMSSRFEGFPNTLAEAMACGCAAVSYDCDTGPREILRHEVDGLLVSPVGDVGTFAGALARLMEDDNLRMEMAARAAEVRDRYSIASVMKMWDELFASVIRPSQLA